MQKASTPFYNCNFKSGNLSQMSYNSISSIDVSSASLSNTEMQASSSCSSSNTSSLNEGRKRRKQTSFVWEWFRLSADKKHSKCTLCKTSYEFKSTTSQMKYHLGVLYYLMFSLNNEFLNKIASFSLKLN